MSEKVSVRVPAGTNAALERQARKQGVTPSELLRVMLTRHADESAVLERLERMETFLFEEVLPLILQASMSAPALIGARDKPAAESLAREIEQASAIRAVEIRDRFET